MMDMGSLALVMCQPHCVNTYHWWNDGWNKSPYWNVSVAFSLHLLSFLYFNLDSLFSEKNPSQTFPIFSSFSIVSFHSILFLWGCKVEISLILGSLWLGSEQWVMIVLESTPLRPLVLLFARVCLRSLTIFYSCFILYLKLSRYRYWSRRNLHHYSWSTWVRSPE